MKLVFKDADWSANGIDSNIVSLVATREFNADTIATPLCALEADKKYMIELTVTTGGGSVVYPAVGTTIVTSATPIVADTYCADNTMVRWYFTAASSQNLYLRKKSGTTLTANIIVYEVVNDNRYSFVYCKQGGLVPSNYVLDSSKTYNLHIKLLYDSSTKFKIYEGTTLLQGYNAVSGTEYSYSFTGKTNISFRPDISDLSHFGYWFEEVS